MGRTAANPTKTLRTLQTSRRQRLRPHNSKKREEPSGSDGGLKVNWPRPRQEIRLRYVVFPEETHWRCKVASTKSLVRLPSKSCSAPGKRKFNRSRVVQKADQVYLVLGSARADFFKPPQPIVSFVPKVGSLREYCVVVATEPIDAGNTGVAVLGNVPRCCGRANAVPPQTAFGGTCGWFGGAGPGFRPNNARCGSGRGGGPFLAPRKVQGQGGVIAALYKTHWAGLCPVEVGPSSVSSSEPASGGSPRLESRDLERALPVSWASRLGHVQDLSLPRVARVLTGRHVACCL